MATAFPFPCRIQRGTGDYYYFDGVNPGTKLLGDAGSTLNTVLGNAGTFAATTTQFDTIQDYFLARKLAFDRLAACETCPTVSELVAALDDAYGEVTG